MRDHLVKCVSLLLLLPALLGAVPVIERPVTDAGGVLTAAQRETVSAELVRLREQTGAQMAVLVVDTTGDEPIEDYALRTAQAWRGGQAGHDNGLLFVLAVRDRRMRLDVGYGLEEHLPDDAVRLLLDAQGPLMRQQDYTGALVHIIQGIRARLPGGATPEERAAAGVPASTTSRESWDSGLARTQALEHLLVVALALWVLIAFVHHPVTRPWFGPRAPLLASGGGAVLALGYAIFTTRGKGLPTADLLVMFSFLCTALLVGRVLLFKGGFARVGLGLSLGPPLAVVFCLDMSLGDTEVFTRFLNYSMALSVLVVVGTFENITNAVVGGFIFLVGGSEAYNPWRHSGSHRFTFTVSSGGSSSGRSRSSSSSSSSRGSSSSGSSWGGGGGSFGGGGASSSW